MGLAADMAQAADAWLGSLPAAQWELALYPGPGPGDRERTTWFYTPTDHGGLPLGEQRPAQQRLAMRLIASGLSLAGYATVSAVMGLENVEDRVESWTSDWGRERGRDPGLYYLRVFGSPGDGTWGWRCGGHHVSLNYTVVDGQVRSCTPCFIGAHPARTALLAGGVLEPLGGIEAIARQLAASLAKRGETAVIIHRSAVSDIVSGNRAQVRDGDEMVHMQDLWRARFTDERLRARVEEVDVTSEAGSGYGARDHSAVAITARPKGVSGAALTPDELALLLRLLDGYLQRFPEEFAVPWLAGYRNGGLAGLHFAYAGEGPDAAPVYYRLQDQKLLIEYDNTQYAANHAHSVVRDLRSDFGFDALAEHRRAFHGPGTALGAD
ncbi:MAG: DUF3500 domain-containing protein [Trebonia sp.]